MEFKGLQWILWVLAAEALIIVLNPSGRLSKLLLALTFVAVIVGFYDLGPYSFQRVVVTNNFSHSPTPCSNR